MTTDCSPRLHLHGWHIERFLSTYFSPIRTFWAKVWRSSPSACSARKSRERAAGRHRGWEIVLQQAETQVRPDGFHFEQSVYYHVYALDFFLSRAPGRKNAIAHPAHLRSHHRQNDAKPSAPFQAGRPPNFGDDDGGHVIGARPFARSPPTRRARRPDLRRHLYHDLPPLPTLHRCRPQGAFAGGHGHADALSIQLMTDGRPVLIDPGTFCYVCPERDRFRGTAAHNTLQVDGRDQATPAVRFAWTGMPETTVDAGSPAMTSISSPATTTATIPSSITAGSSV